jgi:hypothetical protein
MKKFIILATAALTGTSAWAGIKYFVCNENTIKAYLAGILEGGDLASKKEAEQGIFRIKTDPLQIGDKINIQCPDRTGWNTYIKMDVRVCSEYDHRESIAIEGNFYSRKLSGEESYLHYSKICGLKFSGIDQSKEALFICYKGPSVETNFHIVEKEDGSHLLHVLEQHKEPREVKKIPGCIDVKYLSKMRSSTKTNMFEVIRTGVGEISVFWDCKKGITLDSLGQAPHEKDIKKEPGMEPLYKGVFIFPVQIQALPPKVESLNDERYEIGKKILLSKSAAPLQENSDEKITSNE